MRREEDGEEEESEEERGGAAWTREQTSIVSCRLEGSWTGLRGKRG